MLGKCYWHVEFEQVLELAGLAESVSSDTSPLPYNVIWRPMKADSMGMRHAVVTWIPMIDDESGALPVFDIRRKYLVDEKLSPAGTADAAIVWPFAINPTKTLDLRTAYSTVASAYPGMTARFREEGYFATVAAPPLDNGAGGYPLDQPLRILSLDRAYRFLVSPQGAVPGHVLVDISAENGKVLATQLMEANAGETWEPIEFRPSYSPNFTKEVVHFDSGNPTEGEKFCLRDINFRANLFHVQNPGLTQPEFVCQERKGVAYGTRPVIFGDRSPWLTSYDPNTPPTLPLESIAGQAYFSIGLVADVLRINLGKNGIKDGKGLSVYFFDASSPDPSYTAFPDNESDILFVGIGTSDGTGMVDVDPETIAHEIIGHGVFPAIRGSIGNPLLEGKAIEEFYGDVGALLTWSQYSAGAVDWTNVFHLWQPEAQRSFDNPELKTWIAGLNGSTCPVAEGADPDGGCGRYWASGPLRYMFYLLSTGIPKNLTQHAEDTPGIGLDRATDHLFEAAKLVPGYASFESLRLAMQIVALRSLGTSLPGAASDYQAIEDAFCAIGVGYCADRSPVTIDCDPVTHTPLYGYPYTQHKMDCRFSDNDGVKTARWQASWMKSVSDLVSLGRVYGDEETHEFSLIDKEKNAEATFATTDQDADGPAEFTISVEACDFYENCNIYEESFETDNTAPGLISLTASEVIGEIQFFWQLDEPADMIGDPVVTRPSGTAAAMLGTPSCFEKVLGSFCEATFDNSADETGYWLTSATFEDDFGNERDIEKSYCNDLEPPTASRPGPLVDNLYLNSGFPFGLLTTAGKPDYHLQRVTITENDQLMYGDLAHLQLKNINTGKRYNFPGHVVGDVAEFQIPWLQPDGSPTLETGIYWKRVYVLDRCELATMGPDEWWPHAYDPARGILDYVDHEPPHVTPRGEVRRDQADLVITLDLDLLEENKLRLAGNEFVVERAWGDSSGVEFAFDSMEPGKASDGGRTERHIFRIEAREPYERCVYARVKNPVEDKYGNQTTTFADGEVRYKIGCAPGYEDPDAPEPPPTLVMGGEPNVTCASDDEVNANSRDLTNTYGFKSYFHHDSCQWPGWTGADYDYDSFYLSNPITSRYANSTIRFSALTAFPYRSASNLSLVQGDYYWDWYFETWNSTWPCRNHVCPSWGAFNIELGDEDTRYWELPLPAYSSPDASDPWRFVIESTVSDYDDPSYPNYLFETGVKVEIIH